MQTLKDLFSTLDGKKSYIIAFAVAAVGLAEAFGWTPPGWLVTLLASFGIVAGKSALAKLEPSK